MNANVLRAVLGAALFTAPITLAACTSDDGGPMQAEGTGGTTTGEVDGSSSGDESGSGPELGGEELFVQFCSACHGPTAEGTTLAYEIRHPVRDYARWVVRNGRPGLEFESSSMPAWPPETVSDADLDKIFDYLDSFPQPTTGEGLYLDYCRNCHGDPIDTGVVLKVVGDEEYADVIEQVRDGDELGLYELRQEFMPAFSRDMLTDEEVDAIFAFIRGQ
jgi:mono/diheme cytochrome c family protein